MFSCSFACFYNSRIVLVALLASLEAIAGIFRFSVFFAPALQFQNKTFSVNLENINDSIVVAFGLDACSSIIGIFVGLSIILIIILMPILFLLACCWTICRNGSMSIGSICQCIFGVKAFHRCISLNCNCPSYRTRPRLRFGLRLSFLLVCFMLRCAAIVLYYLNIDIDTGALLIFYACAGSLVFLLGTILLDFYHCAVWRCYTPSTDHECCGRSKKHKRYIPYNIAGEQSRKDVYGDRPCSEDPCRNQHLGHVLLYHGRDFKPQPRWRYLKKNHKTTYIGFHITDPEAARSIVHSEFRPSVKGMLGKGVYFARSIGDAAPKAQSSGGACIVAEIRMGNVFEFNKSDAFTEQTTNESRQLRKFVTGSEWHDEYDTCYMNHMEEKRDEFCIKNPEQQIIKWIVVIDGQYDRKIRDYGLDKELDSTRCNCI